MAAEIARLHNPTPVPFNGQRVWQAFWEVNTSRHGTELGPSAITYTEIKAWSDLMEEKLEPWEVSAFRRMDTAYLQEVGKKLNEGT
jgi:hypothetical protein